MKTAFVTGSTKGIGKQIGLDLLDKGYYVYFNYAHDDSTFYRLFAELEKNYRNQFQIIRVDLSDINEIDKIKQIIKENLDVLILNAGITDRAKFGEITLENWNHVFNVNLTNQFFLIQTLKDKIKENGRIIFISSISGITPDAISISYGVSKAAINMLVPYLAKEFKEKKITVNAVAPGYTDTSWHVSKNKAQIKRIEQKCLASRLGTTKEISKVVLSIIDNDFINGQVIRVDGGFGL